MIQLVLLSILHFLTYLSPLIVLLAPTGRANEEWRIRLSHNSPTSG